MHPINYLRRKCQVTEEFLPRETEGLGYQKLKELQWHAEYVRYFQGKNAAISFMFALFPVFVLAISLKTGVHGSGDVFALIMVGLIVLSSFTIGMILSIEVVAVAAARQMTYARALKDLYTPKS